ncbi:MAG: hypothetical protein ACR2LH_02025 [Thermoleophilaceae bacterium]
MAEQGSGEGFLPPQPGGREPDLGGGEGSREPDDTSTAQAQQGFAPPAGSDTSSADQGWGQHQPPQGQQGQQPPQGQQQWGQQAPQQGWGGQQPPQQWGGQPPPQWQGQPGRHAGWGQAPSGWQHQQTAPQPWVYQPRPPAEPDNGPAVAGFTLAMVSSGLLLLSVGLSSIVSAICSGLAIVYSRRGRSRVDAGETPKHRGLAQAGFVTGIVSLALSVLATAFWGLLLVLAITDEGFRRELELELEQSSLGDGARGALVAALAAGGLLARLVA